MLTKHTYIHRMPYQPHNVFLQTRGQRIHHLVHAPTHRATKASLATGATCHHHHTRMQIGHKEVMHNVFNVHLVLQFVRRVALAGEQHQLVTLASLLKCIGKSIQKICADKKG